MQHAMLEAVTTCNIFEQFNLFILSHFCCRWQSAGLTWVLRPSANVLTAIFPGWKGERGESSRSLFLSQIETHW